MNNQWILAQADGTTSPARINSEPISGGAQSQTQAPGSQDAAGEGAETQQPQGFNPLQLMLPVVMLVLVFMMFRSPRKQQQKQKQMIQSLQKNDRVRTIGGIVGTIMDVKEDEVVLKIDESNNTKIRIVASAVAKNLSQDTE
ncbi:preprotein translocase subunit YajC [Planctomycetota bacterium]